MNVKNIFKKENVMPVAALAIICLIVAALMGAVNMITEPVINEAEEQKVYDSLREVIDGTFAPADIPEGSPSTVTALYKVTDGDTLVGHAVTLKAKGYAGDILLTVGIDADGKVIKAVITGQSETHGKAGMANYTDNYQGVGAESISDVELFSGATVSSTAIKSAIIDALNTVTGGNISAPDSGDKEEAAPITSPKTDAEIIALANELVKDAVGFEDVTPGYGKPDTLIRLYRETGGKGYVAYVVTPGQYVPVANEGLVHIDMNGDIVGINHLTWVVGHGAGADGFADNFVGKDYWHLDEVELISGSTTTSGDFKAAVAAALDVVTKLIPRSEKKLMELMDELVPNSECFEKLELAEGAPQTLKALYRETSGKGYVAYVVTPGEYVAVATESLVYFNTEGTIKDVNLLVWTVGHGVDAGDFASGFIGKNQDTVNDVELVTSATTTSRDMKDAIAAAMPYIPKDFPVARVIGIAAVVLSVLAVAGFAVYINIKRRRNG